MIANIYAVADEWNVAEVWGIKHPVAREDRDLADTFEANARLIAAAPELLAACKELVVAVAAAMRVVADLDALHRMGASAVTRQQRLIDELHVSGVVDGFGVRAQAIVAKVEGQ